jgi:hypothetical protein
MGRDVAAMVAGSASGLAAAVVVGLSEPEAVSLRCAVGTCRCAGDEADFRICGRASLLLRSASVRCARRLQRCPARRRCTWSPARTCP